VLAWSWGLSEEPPQTGGGGGVGKVKGKDLSTQKLVDLASPLLLLASAEGKHISAGTLTARNESKGGVAQEFLLFKMRDVLVTSVNMAESSKDEIRPLETVTLNFAKLEFDYRSFKQDGSVDQEKIFGWDFPANKKL
jgi:type VI secretion system secreted protein Hcp